MAYFNNLRPTMAQTKEHIDYLCGKTITILSEDNFDFGRHYQEMYQAVSHTLTGGLGRELYAKLRLVFNEFLQKMHYNLFSFADGKKTVCDQLFLLLFRQWFCFSERLVVLRQLFFNLESVLENSIGEESLVFFAWRSYRSLLMEDSVMFPKLLLHIIEVQSLWYKIDADVLTKADNKSSKKQINGWANWCSRSVSRHSLFSNDVLYDFLRCVDTATLGLSVALCCRRFANFADLILRTRMHSDCALMLYDGQNELLRSQEKRATPNGAFAVRLCSTTGAKIKGKGFGRHIYHQNGMTLYQVIDQWFCNPIEQTPLELSVVEVPEWITGMHFLYLLDGVTPSVLPFLHRISPKLKNCCLKFELVSFWSKLQTSGLLLSFVSLFNPLTFSLQMTFDELQFYCINRPNPYFYKLPLWATLQSIFFPNCYDLSLPICLFSSREIGIDIATWLHNKNSGTKLPRRILLADHQKEMDLTEKSFGMGIKAMIRLIKERFGGDMETHHFIVESSTKLVNAWEERFLLNGNGECLLISPNRIVRCSNGNEHAKFEQFHEHLSRAEDGKGCIATVQIGTNESVRRFKEVMAQIVKKNNDRVEKRGKE